MPPINIYKCNSCDLEFPRGWGGYRYVEDASGKRIACPHPSENATVTEVIAEIAQLKVKEVIYYYYEKPRWWWSKTRKRDLLQKKEYIKTLVDEKPGYNSHCLCSHCLKICLLDIGDGEIAEKSWRYYYGATKRKDKRECPYCGSSEIFTVFELIGRNCPKCGKGTIIEIRTGMIS